ncbi:MAG TPA: penicillin-binding protein 1C, partial [Caldimonas sp.]
LGVWIGNASGEAMHSISGVSGAAPVWQAMAAALHAGAVSRAPLAPAGVVRLRVAFDSAREPARDEVFLAGSERALQRATAEVEGARRFGITSPRDGSVFAIDPDIPPAAQRITFEGEHGKWVLDGKPLGTAERWRWAPWPGRHRLTLVGGDNQELQSVSFEVRGAGVKPPAATKATSLPGPEAKAAPTASRKAQP